MSKQSRVKVSTEISPDNKTLIWIDSDFKPSERWNRWYVAITSPGAVKLCNPNKIDVIIIDSKTYLYDWYNILSILIIINKSITIIGKSSIVASLKKLGFAHSNLFEYGAFDSDLEDSSDIRRVILSYATKTNMNRIAWSVKYDDLPPTYIETWAAACCKNGVPKIIQLSKNADDSIIPKTWLVYQYYEDKNPQRFEEIKTCLMTNLECTMIDRILLLNEEVYDLPSHPKLQVEIIGEYLTYYDIFIESKKHVPMDDFIIFCNSDIIFNDSLHYLWKIRLAEERLFLAILRWETLEPPKIYGPCDSSQDAWIIARKNIDFKIQKAEVAIPFGKPGCELSLSRIIYDKGFLVANPAYDIKILHNHKSEIRNYTRDEGEFIRKNWLFVEPSYIDKPVGYAIKETESAIKCDEDTKIFVEAKKISKIILPSREKFKDFWSHAGDEFREMVEIWEELGFVKIEHSESTPYCWWDEIGNVLLYDRPTSKWWGLITNPYFNLAFFANCEPPGPPLYRSKQSVWSFWGKHPKLLESINTKRMNRVNFEDRIINSVFIESDKLTHADWKATIKSIFEYGPNLESYQLCLDKLCKSRFGLCLPEEGRKHNREIEYFCCGVVPIVTKDVDMKNYLFRPTEGVHYFIVSTPEDVNKIIETTTPEKWKSMSDACICWWEKNASASGLFEVTKNHIEHTLKK
jgi:hypothetical protein